MLCNHMLVIFKILKLVSIYHCIVFGIVRVGGDFVVIHACVWLLIV